MIDWLNNIRTKKTTIKVDPEDKELIKQLKKENKRLSKEISQLKVNLLEYDSIKEELNDIYTRYAELNKEIEGKRNYESDIQNIQTLVFLSIKMRNLLIKCRKEMLPVNLGQEIDNILKDARELD